MVCTVIHSKALSFAVRGQVLNLLVLVLTRNFILEFNQYFLSMLMQD
jgi:hypothetical protein